MVDHHYCGNICHVGEHHHLWKAIKVTGRATDILRIGSIGTSLSYLGGFYLTRNLSVCMKSSLLMLPQSHHNPHHYHSLLCHQEDHHHHHDVEA